MIVFINCIRIFFYIISRQTGEFSYFVGWSSIVCVCVRFFFFGVEKLKGVFDFRTYDDMTASFVIS
jgi:hypothetical protein